MAVKKIDYFSALYDVAKVINASLRPSRVLEEIVTCVASTMNAKACSLRVLDARKKRLLMGAQHGLSEGYIRKGPVTVQRSGLDKQALKGETIWLKNVQTDDRWQYKEKAKTEGIRSVLVVPLVVEGKAIGVLRVYSGKVRKFKPEEIKFLEAVANLSAISLENAKLHQALRKDYDLVIAHEYRLDDN
ncbi:MAG: GAF domain-containing protein [Desulfobacteraceae bacterium]|jgi:signal transduction protein with GAF and PtsI domain|nr:GAF domain-containing protein [Desulfobacteraceae bacterium]